MANGQEKKDEHKQRAPYVPPAIEESGSFERLALACGHTPGQMGQEQSCTPMKGGTTNS